MIPDAPFYTLYLANADETARLAVWFSSRLRAGDCILLQGSVGAGKSHFARAFVQSRLGRAEDVPSPSFTLVQTYQADVELWHADLYRLTHPHEVQELGLEDAFQSAICLIEWPDRLGKSAPIGAMTLHFTPKSDGRSVRIWLGARSDLLSSLTDEFALDA